MSDVLIILGILGACVTAGTLYFMGNTPPRYRGDHER